MNFLEQVVAEWFFLQGYFVRTNIKYGPRSKGGFEGEMDVAAFHPQSRELVHVETSMDALSWDKRRERFSSKFGTAGRHYSELFTFPIDKVRRIAVVGFARDGDASVLGGDIEVKSIPQFIREIASEIAHRHPLKRALSENLPLLRSMQFALYWGELGERS